VSRARSAVALAYVVALVVALWAGRRCGFEHPLAVALWADAVATVVVFAFSLAFRNSSFYDPYWSLAPIPIALYWCARPEFAGVNPIRQAVVLTLIVIWGLRLTWNWLRGWEGLRHEDWRYLEVKERTGAAYWLVSFLGIHMLPTLVVFAGLLPVYVVGAAGREPFGPLDLVAFAVTFGAILLEARADRELRRFRAAGPAPQEFLRSGVWAWSRHPNYFGEMGFWWGLWLFALAADPSWWWTVLGPLVITGMFVSTSLPWLERRMRERRPGFAEHAAHSPLVVPRPWRS